MAGLTNSMEQLVQSLRRLPGVGPRTDEWDGRWCNRNEGRRDDTADHHAPPNLVRTVADDTILHRSGVGDQTPKGWEVQHRHSQRRSAA